MIRTIKGALLLCLMQLTTPLVAQETARPIRVTTIATTAELGSGTLYDSYLAESAFTGTQLSLGSEAMRVASCGDGRFVTQHQLLLSGMLGLNSAYTTASLGGYMDYSYGWLYRFKPWSNFTFMAGAAIDGELGGIYNPLNGNNPATLKTAVNLELTALFAYTLHLGDSPIKLRYQLSTPVVGALFSPHFGQSYYEIFELGNYAGTVHLASLHNQINLQSHFTADLPLWGKTFRVGYRYLLRTSQVNYLDTYVTSHLLSIGWVINRTPTPKVTQPLIYPY